MCDDDTASRTAGSIFHLNSWHALCTFKAGLGLPSPCSAKSTVRSAARWLCIGGYPGEARLPVRCTTRPTASCFSLIRYTYTDACDSETCQRFFTFVVVHVRRFGSGTSARLGRGLLRVAVRRSGAPCTCSITINQPLHTLYAWLTICFPRSPQANQPPAECRSESGSSTTLLWQSLYRLQKVRVRLRPAATMKILHVHLARSPCT